MDERLSAYGRSDYYPFHMPGHKRQTLTEMNPYQMDITEIYGFDNLHHAEGVIAELQQAWASIYGCDRALLLVNGSTCGNEAAIFAATEEGDTILVGRGCHKSVYHAMALRHLQPVYLFPDITEQGLVEPTSVSQVEKAIQQHPEATVVMITSPTYEGLCADVSEIANVVHGANMALIIDAAHGAHFGLSPYFPTNAIAQGADAVIVSLHKTLPTFTQSACLLWNKSSRISIDRIQKYLGYFESSSPSYLLMASTSAALRFLEKEGEDRFAKLYRRLNQFRQTMEGLTHVDVSIPHGWHGTEAYDISKIIIRGKDIPLSGEKEMEFLRQEAHLELEMASPTYALAMTSLMDTEEGFLRLEGALRALDKKAEEIQTTFHPSDHKFFYQEQRQQVVPLWQAKDAKTIHRPWKDAAGSVAGSFISLYPPGIPVFAPGERMEAAGVDALIRAEEQGYQIDGTQADGTVEIIE